MNRELLEKPFGPEQIKRREGNFGRTLDYISGADIIQRLNDAFDAEWSFRIILHEIIKEADEVFVLGELKACDIVKTQFGSSKITRARESGEMISLADDLKSAATDALKKAATLLGVGLHLYNDKGEDIRPRDQKGHVKVGFDPVEGLPNVYKPNYSVHDNHGDEHPTGNGNGNGNGYKNRQLSMKQYNYIKSLGKKTGYDYTALTRMCLDIFGTKIEGLSTSDASHLIAHLQNGKPIPDNTPAPAHEHQLDS